MSLALIGLTAATLAPMMAFGVMGLFGVAYIVSSGAFLLWGIALFSDCPDLGLGLPFLMVALGQPAVAPLFGAVSDAAGSGMALLCFVAIMGSDAFWGPITALTREQEVARTQNMTSLPETPAEPAGDLTEPFSTCWPVISGKCRSTGNESRHV
jgi:hypothetical protein